MDLRRDVAREIARIYCRLSPLGIEALSEILVPSNIRKAMWYCLKEKRVVTCIS